MAHSAPTSPKAAYGAVDSAVPRCPVVSPTNLHTPVQVGVLAVFVGVGALVGGVPALDSASAWLITDGAVTYGPAPIASGAPGAETPTGTTVVDWKSRYHHSREFGGVHMHYAVFFAPGGIAFHEGPVDHPSAGCVRLETDAASRFFDTLAVGDEVQVR